MILLKQMMVLFLLMLVGVVCRKKSVLNDEAARRLSSLVVKVANPALILSSSINQESVIRGEEFLQIFLLAAGVYAALLLAAQFLPVLLGAGRSEYGVYRVMFIFSNIGFMGFPMISAVYGSQALLKASPFLIVFNCLVYTYGIQMLSGGAGTKSVSAGGTGAKGAANGEPGESTGLQWKRILNMGVLACVLSLALYLLAVPVPDFVESAVDYLGGLTTPLSMIIIGDSLAQIPLKQLFADKRLLIFSLLKLIPVPVLGTFAVLALGVSPEVAGVCMIIFAAPVASMTVMLAQEYGGSLELATKGVALTTLLSVATIPLVSLITGV